MEALVGRARARRRLRGSSPTWPRARGPAATGSSGWPGRARSTALGAVREADAAARRRRSGGSGSPRSGRAQRPGRPARAAARAARAAASCASSSAWETVVADYALDRDDARRAPDGADAPRARPGDRCTSAELERIADGTRGRGRRAGRRPPAAGDREGDRLHAARGRDAGSINLIVPPPVFERHRARGPDGAARPRVGAARAPRGRDQRPRRRGAGARAARPAAGRGAPHRAAGRARDRPGRPRPRAAAGGGLARWRRAPTASAGADDQPAVQATDARSLARRGFRPGPYLGLRTHVRETKEQFDGWPLRARPRDRLRDARRVRARARRGPARPCDVPCRRARPAPAGRRSRRARRGSCRSRHRCVALTRTARPARTPSYRSPPRPASCAA